MVSPHRIRYNNVFSDVGLGDLDVIFDVAFDSDNGAMSSYLNRSAVASESYDGRYKNTTRYKFDELFSPQFTIVKRDFSDFTQEDVRKVLKYLTSTDRPALLEVYYDGSNNVVGWACIGGFVSVEMYKIANSRTVGIVAKFEAITPFAMSDLRTVTKTIPSPTGNKITINIDTDDNKPVYPRITIQQQGDGRIRIANNDIKVFTDDMIKNAVYFNGTTNYWKSDRPEQRSSTTKPDYKGWTTINVASVNDVKYADNTFYYNTVDAKYYWLDPYMFHEQDDNPNLKTTGVRLSNKHTDLFDNEQGVFVATVKNNTLDEKVILDGANKIISSSRATRIFGNDFEEWTWLPLYDGKNEITVEGNCTVTIEYREVRKVGEY